MAVNRKTCDAKFDWHKAPRSRPRNRTNKPAALTALDRLNGWTTTKLKKLRRGEFVGDLPAREQIAA